MGKRGLIFFAQFILLYEFIICYKPVVIMHGVLDGPQQMMKLAKFIEKGPSFDKMCIPSDICADNKSGTGLHKCLFKAHIGAEVTQTHPGTNITVIDAYDGFSSLYPMWTQANYISGKIQAVMDQHPDGIHMLGYSQGALLSRGMIQNFTKHNIINFISLSGPQGGQYGDTRVFRYLFPFYLKEELYRVFYTSHGQGVSVANYWNDPHHQHLYDQYSSFLAVINNQRTTNRSSHFKNSFTRLKNVVLIGGPGDRVITPWQSSQFAAYNDSEVVIDIKQQKWYTEDLFGLRTLDKRGALHTCTMDGVPHTEWHKNFTVYQKCIEPWLT